MTSISSLNGTIGWNSKPGELAKFTLPGQPRNFAHDLQVQWVNLRNLDWTSRLPTGQIINIRAV